MLVRLVLLLVRLIRTGWVEARGPRCYARGKCGEYLARSIFTKSYAELYVPILCGLSHPCTERSIMHVFPDIDYGILVSIMQDFS